MGVRRASGGTSAYCYGEDVGEFKRFGNCVENTPERTRVVGRRGANAFGLYDVGGNVWEWTRDTYGVSTERTLGCA